MSIARNKYFGFSLIELLVAITILSILVAIAIPSYLTYKSKAKVGDAFQALEEYKLRTIKLMVKTGANPDIADILFPESDFADAVNSNNKYVTTQYVTQVHASIVNGSVLLGAKLKTSGEITSSNDYVYIAYQSNRWYCGTFAQSNSVVSSLLPSTCNKNTAL